MKSACSLVSDGGMAFLGEVEDGEDRSSSGELCPCDELLLNTFSTRLRSRLLEEPPGLGGSGAITFGLEICSTDGGRRLDTSGRDSDGDVESCVVL